MEPNTVIVEHTSSRYPALSAEDIKVFGPFGKDDATHVLEAMQEKNPNKIFLMKDLSLNFKL